MKWWTWAKYWHNLINRTHKIEVEAGEAETELQQTSRKGLNLRRRSKFNQPQFNPAQKCRKEKQNNSKKLYSKPKWSWGSNLKLKPRSTLRLRSKSRKIVKTQQVDYAEAITEGGIFNWKIKFSASNFEISVVSVCISQSSFWRRLEMAPPL